MIYVVLVKGHVHGVYSSPVDAHLVAKPLNATVEQCSLNGQKTVPCDHEWEIESMYGTKSERICKKCDVYQSDLLSPDCVMGIDGSCV